MKDIFVWASFYNQNKLSKLNVLVGTKDASMLQNK